MKLLLDQGLPRSTVFQLQKAGIESSHVGERNLSTANDLRILEVARQEGWVIVTLDADFHALLALSAAAAPSVIRIRMEGLRGENLATLMSKVLDICREDLTRGAMVSVNESGIRVRLLPLLR